MNNALSLWNRPRQSHGGLPRRRAHDWTWPEKDGGGEVGGGGYGSVSVRPQKRLDRDQPLLGRVWEDVVGVVKNFQSM